MDVGSEMIETRNAERILTILLNFMSSQKYVGPVDSTLACGP